MTHVNRYDTDYDNGRLILAGPNGYYMECSSCLVPADMPRELLGQAIYRATYEHQGGDWRAVETKDFWYETADRLIALLEKGEPVK